MFETFTIILKYIEMCANILYIHVKWLKYRNADTLNRKYDCE